MLQTFCTTVGRYQISRKRYCSEDCHRSQININLPTTTLQSKTFLQRPKIVYTIHFENTDSRSIAMVIETTGIKWSHFGQSIHLFDMN